MTRLSAGRKDQLERDRPSATTQVRLVSVDTDSLNVSLACEERSGLEIHFYESLV